MLSMAAAMRKLPATLSARACTGSGPRRQVRWPRTSKSGCTRSIAAGSPAATMASCPAAAASGRPKTGAATYPTPCRRCSAASSSASPTEMVARLTCTVPAGAEAGSPCSSTVSRMAPSSASIVSTTPPKASRAEATASAP